METREPFQLQAYQRSYTLAPFDEPDPWPTPISLAAYAWLDSPDLARSPP